MRPPLRHYLVTVERGGELHAYEVRGLDPHAALKRLELRDPELGCDLFWGRAQLYAMQDRGAA